MQLEFIQRNKQNSRNTLQFQEFFEISTFTDRNRRRHDRRIDSTNYRRSTDLMDKEVTAASMNICKKSIQSVVRSLPDNHVIYSKSFSNQVLGKKPVSMDFASDK
jgi:hypothetical protein